jgi:hypothetical protein
MNRPILTPVLFFPLKSLVFSVDCSFWGSLTVGSSVEAANLKELCKTSIYPSSNLND